VACLLLLLLQAATQPPSSHISTCHPQLHPAAAATPTTGPHSSVSLLTTLLQQQSLTYQGLQQLTHPANLLLLLRLRLRLLLPNPTQPVVGYQASSSSSSNKHVRCQLP
jgi:hypothetical protein